MYAKKDCVCFLLQYVVKGRRILFFFCFQRANEPNFSPRSFHSMGLFKIHGTNSDIRVMKLIERAYKGPEFENFHHN